METRESSNAGPANRLIPCIERRLGPSLTAETNTKKRRRRKIEEKETERRREEEERETRKEKMEVRPVTIGAWLLRPSCRTDVRSNEGGVRRICV